MFSSDGYIACRLEAATALVGVIFFNSFAGRSGEWELMQSSHVTGQLDKCSTFLLCPQHKTVATYGSLAKHVPAGSWHAFRLYLDLPGKHTDRFIEPPTATSTQASVAGLLKRFGVLAFKTDDPPNSNLIRKMFHSCLIRMSRDKEAMRFMEKIDAHSEHMREVHRGSTALFCLTWTGKCLRWRGAAKRCASCTGPAGAWVRAPQAAATRQTPEPRRKKGPPGRRG